MKSTIAAFAVAGLMMAAGAQAQVFNNLGAFQTAIGNDAGSFTNTFTGGASTTSLQSFSGGSSLMAYAITGPTAGGVYRNNTFIGNNFDNSIFTITFTSNNVLAVGGNFFITDINDAFVANANVTLTYNDGTTDTFTPANAAAFSGYVSTLPITSLVMSAPGTSRFNTIDNLIVSSIPTPGAAAVLALAALVGGRRRR